jgi:uncharacterized membrane protein YbhN (UPF0104 family)
MDSICNHDICKTLLICIKTRKTNNILCIKALSLFSIGFIKYYQSKRESEISVTIVTMASLTLIFATVTLLPIDIFLVSSTVDKQTGLKKLWADSDTIYWMTVTVQILYYGNGDGKYFFFYAYDAMCE